MKTKIRFIIIAGVVLLLLIGGVVALKLTAPAEEETEDTTEVVETSLLYDKNPDDITSVTIKNAVSEYKVERVGKDGVYVWTVFEYSDAPSNTSFINTIVTNAATMTAQKTVAENAEDLSIYGLSEPQAEYRVEFDDSDKTVKEICIGASVPGTSSTVYACFKGENTVYTVKASDINCFLQDKTNCVNKTVYTAYVSADEEDTTDYTHISKITISRKDIDYDIVLEYDTRLDDEDAIVSNSSKFVMTSPVKLDMNPEKGDAVTTDMFGLTADSFAVIKPTEEQLAEYGFSDPYARFEFNITGGDLVLTVGNEALDEDGNKLGYYVMSEDIDVIYIFSEASLPWLTVMPLDITTTMITSNYVYTLTELDITGANTDAHFTITGSSDDDFEVKLDGVAVDKQAFKDFYQFILRAPAEQLHLEEVSGEPELTVEIKTASGGDTLEFYPIENRRTAICVNGTPSFTCKTAYLERLIENTEKVRNGEEIIANW